MKKKILLALVTGFVISSPGYSQELTSEMQRSLNSAARGTIVQLKNFLTEKLPRVDYKKIVQPGPQFLISDDPEYVRVPEAIVLQEAVHPGTVRLYLYNVNGVQEPKKIDRKITAVIRNLGKQTMHLKMLRYSSQKPTTNYFLAGKNGLRDFFGSSAISRVYSVKAGEAIPLDPQLEKNVVKYDELVHGFYEFLVDQPAQVSVIQNDPETSGSVALKRIKSVYPPKGTNAGRGLFGVSNYLVRTKDTLITMNGIRQLIVADGDSDPWIEGTEGSTGIMTRNAGNYGVLYHIEMKWKSTDGKGLALVTWNSRAGDNKWCGGMANTMVVSDGKFPGGVIQLPSNELRVKADPDAILVQIFKPDLNKEVQELKLTYSPPGASCLPTPLIFIPVELN
jgi:hypothetical protein